MPRNTYKICWWNGSARNNWKVNWVQLYFLSLISNWTLLCKRYATRSKKIIVVNWCTYSIFLELPFHFKCSSILPIKIWFITQWLIYDFRNVYVSTVQPQSKHLVIVMDHGNSLSPNQLRIAKGIAKHILSSLSEKDRVCMLWELFPLCRKSDLFPQLMEIFLNYQLHIHIYQG